MQTQLEQIEAAAAQHNASLIIRFDPDISSTWTAEWEMRDPVFRETTHLTRCASRKSVAVEDLHAALVNLTLITEP